MSSVNRAHEGEQIVQRRVGEGGPHRGSPMFGPELAKNVAGFLKEQQMVVIGGPAADGAVWSSILTGPAGFIDPIGETTIKFSSVLGPGDPLRYPDGVEHPVGTLALDTTQARRIRANGIMYRSGGALLLRTEQVLRNCPKYIHIRELIDKGTCQPKVSTGTRLSAAQQEWVAKADTFFVATYSPAHGADVSHRGGPPGFVTTGQHALSWPDYVGNSFYMTFGNLEFNDECGLCFLDWELGHTLQIAGTAAVRWENKPSERANRTVHFEVKRVVQTTNAIPLRWQLVDYSKFTPACQKKEFGE